MLKLAGIIVACAGLLVLAAPILVPVLPRLDIDPLIVRGLGAGVGLVGVFLFFST